MKTLFPGIIFLLLFPGWVQADKIPEDELAHKAGQMHMVGFRGLSVDQDSPIVRDIKAGRVGGVILFDYDVALKSPVRNVEYPEHVGRSLRINLAILGMGHLHQCLWLLG